MITRRTEGGRQWAAYDLPGEPAAPMTPAEARRIRRAEVDTIRAARMSIGLTPPTGVAITPPDELAAASHPFPIA